MSNNLNQEGERQVPATSSTNDGPIPQSLGSKIDEDDISLPLSLIKGLRHRKSQAAKSATAAADSLSSSNTSDKDDSGGDETGGSNTSSGAKMGASLSIGPFGPMSSLSGSEPNDGSNSSGSRAGILRKNCNNASKSDSMSTSSSSEDIAGDELSMRVVARAKSVSNSESYSHQQPQSIKVSFAPEKLCSGEGKGGSVGSDSNNAVAPAVVSTKRKSDPSGTTEHQGDSVKKARTSLQSAPLSAAALAQRNQQVKSFNSVAMVSSASSNTGSGMTQSTGQDSSSNAEQATGQISSSLGSTVHESSKFPVGLQQPNKQMSSEERRLERNQREKERSNRIASQVDTLRTLLQRGGLYIPKNTKSTVLTEASNYIRTLQDRQQLMSMEMENLKDQLLKAVAVRQNLQQAGGASFQQPQDQAKSGDSSKTDSQDYYLIFNNSMAGMAVASMGGALLDCNAAFQTETGLAIKKDSGITIFNIVHPKDLTRALELISHMVDTGYNGNGNNRSSSPQSSGSCSDEPVFIRSSFANKPDLGLCIALVRSEDNVAKCLNITLVKNVGSNGEEFNPSLPAVPSMVPQISATSSEASNSKDQAGDFKAQTSPQSQPVVPTVQVQPQTNVPQQVQHQRPNPGLINNVVLNNSTVPVPPPAMTPVIPTVNAGVGGAPAVLPPQLVQLIQQLQQQPAQPQQQQIHPQLFNLAQYQQQLQQIPMQNQYNIGNALQGANLAMAGQPASNVVQNNVMQNNVMQNNGNGSSQQDQKSNDETVYHFASG